jgi:hypothetical protein
MWPISTRVNKPENDDPSLLDRTGDPFDVWAPLRSEGRAYLGRVRINDSQVGAQRPLLGVKRTWRGLVRMSANDP